jgi:hypothetical protein
MSEVGKWQRRSSTRKDRMTKDQGWYLELSWMEIERWTPNTDGSELEIEQQINIRDSHNAIRWSDPTVSRNLTWPYFWHISWFGWIIVPTNENRNYVRHFIVFSLLYEERAEFTCRFVKRNQNDGFWILPNRKQFEHRLHTMKRVTSISFDTIWEF